jgi:hypothetical protein
MLQTAWDKMRTELGRCVKVEETCSLRGIRTEWVITNTSEPAKLAIRLWETCDELEASIYRRDSRIPQDERLLVLDRKKRKRRALPKNTFSFPSIAQSLASARMALSPYLEKCKSSKDLVTFRPSNSVPAHRGDSVLLDWRCMHCLANFNRIFSLNALAVRQKIST